MGKYKSSRVAKKIVNELDKVPIGRLKEIYLEHKKDSYTATTFCGKKYELKKFDIFDDKCFSEISSLEWLEAKKNTPPTALKTISIFINFLIKELDMDIKNPVTYTLKKTEEGTALTKEEFFELLKYIKKPDYNLACKIAYFHGLRVSEVGGIIFPNFTKKHLIVDRQRSSIENNFVKVKSKERIIPTKKEVYDYFQKLIRSTNIKRIDQRIFHQKYFVQSMSLYLNSKLKDTKFNKITFHDFRHSFITNLLQQNIDYKTVAYLAGDTELTIITRYSHINSNTDEIAKRAIEAL